MKESSSRFFDIEKRIIAFLIGTMTALTFANVIARYVFESNILWSLELTVFIFAWLVLLGAVHAVSTNAHIGVDLVITMVGNLTRKRINRLASVICIIYCVFIFKGSWDYWANYANLPTTSGRWFPTGFNWNFRDQGWYEVYSIPMPDFMRFLEGIFNDGDPYEKIPRFIPYAVLPLFALLMLVRYVYALRDIESGRKDCIIASHEGSKETSSEVQGETR